MTKATENRLDILKDWLTAVLPYHEFDLDTASSDASFRRYYRVEQEGQKWIVMDAPPEQEDVALFAKVDELLFSQGIAVPKIYARNVKQGFLLLSDFGDVSLLAAIKNAKADAYYQRAINELIKMQQIHVQASDLPHYDEARLQQEMHLFPEWFLGRHLDLEPPTWLNALFDQLSASARQQTQVFVHRDYHSRNLMIPDSSTLGVIDFQDAVIGPVSYDLVSLLKDCYIEWPVKQRQQWIDYYLDKAEAANIISSMERVEFIRAFDWMGLQRHLKVLGIFCRLHYRDGKDNYMDDLPQTLRYVLEVAEQYPEFEQLHAYLTDTPKIMAIL